MLQNKKIACYLRNLATIAKSEHYKGIIMEGPASGGELAIRFLGFHVAEGLKSMDLGLHSQSTRHKALGENFM